MIDFLSLIFPMNKKILSSMLTALFLALSPISYADDLWSIKCEEKILKSHFDALDIMRGGGVIDAGFLDEISAFDKIPEFATLRSISKELKAEVFKEFVFPKPLEVINDEGDCLKDLGCIKTYAVIKKDGSDPTTLACLSGKVVYLTEKPDDFTRADLDKKYGKPLQVGGLGPAFVRKYSGGGLVYVQEDQGWPAFIEYLHPTFLNYLEKVSRKRMEKIIKDKKTPKKTLR